MLQISFSAAKEIKRIQNNRQQPDSLVKLTVNSGGCSGLFYELRLKNINSHDENNSASSVNCLLKIDDITLVTNNESQKYLENLTIDYAEDLMGGGFRFNNPQVKNVCGCGISFAPTD